MAYFRTWPTGNERSKRLRAEIARLDAQLLGTLEKRAKASRRLGELRKGQPASMPLGDRAALHALVARAAGELPTEAVREIFREIFGACLALELPVKVAYLAPEGGPAHAAARGRFGASPNLVASESTTAAIEEVARSRVEFAVVPLETRAEGPVQATIDALTESELKIVGDARRAVEPAPRQQDGERGRRREGLRDRRRPGLVRCTSSSRSERASRCWT